MTLLNAMRHILQGAAALCLLALNAGSAVAAEGDSTTVYITGTLVDAPECTVNGNNRIDVDFGNSVVTRLIDGASYMKKDLIYSLSCSGYASTEMKLAVRAGQGADFGSGLIGTDVPGLGIQLMSGSTKIDAGQYIGFTYAGSDVPKLSAVLVASDPLSLKATAFNGTGTMVFEYQ